MSRGVDLNQLRGALSGNKGVGEPDFGSRDWRRFRRTKDVLRCSFCSKLQADVKKLVAGPGAYICDECVALATAAHHEKPLGEEKCSFCGKSGKQIEWLYGEGTKICNECVDLCKEIIAEEQTETKSRVHVAMSSSMIIESAAPPRCVRCRADLLEVARSRSMDVPNDSGKGTTKTLTIFCGNCGEVMAVKIIES